MIRKFAAMMLLLTMLMVATATSAMAPTPIIPIPDSMFSDIPTISEIATSSIPVITDNQSSKLETKPPVVIPSPHVVVVPKVTPAPKIAPTKISTAGFRLDRNVSWYGPGFYGRRTACGLAYTKTIMGVAHKTLPCGTKVTFLYEGRKFVVPVIDRGPYVAGRQWDLSGALCTALHHCFTGSLYYWIGSH